jgi:hypothetical protein
MRCGKVLIQINASLSIERFSELHGDVAERYRMGARNPDRGPMAVESGSCEAAGRWPGGAGT